MNDIRFPQITDWRQRRRLAYRLYGNSWTDTNLPYIIKQYDDESLIRTVVDMFEHGSELIFPPKFIFVNIVYSYYLNKYFGLSFYQMIDTEDLLFDSPAKILYSDNKYVYDQILSKVLDRIESFESINKTRKYFKLEYLIDDEDLTEVTKFNPLKNT